MAAAETASPDRALRELMLVLQVAPPSPPPVPAPRGDIETALLACRRLYDGKRSADALPLARAALAAATALGDRNLIRRCCTTCGALCSDSTDVVSAIEHHVQALRMATADDDRMEMSRTWNNIGVAVTNSGNVGLASRCYQRALSIVETHPEPVYSRFAALTNLANCAYKMGRHVEGLEYAQRGALELTAEFIAHDPHAAVLLQRNLVRLLVANGRTADAESHVARAATLATAGNSRAAIAGETARAAYELATGNIDIALTRLDQALGEARKVPGSLQDTLVCMIRAEEEAGYPARALLHLEELSEHVYRSGIARARRMIEQAGLRDVEPAIDDSAREQDKARLISKLERPAQPEDWQALQRLGVNAVLRMDESGWHGVRVGALTKALAVAYGMTALQAQEIGLAAELHDVGMMSVPETLLAKQGRLNDAERALVRRHVEAGAEVLSDASHPRMLLARDIIQYHHAFWDGSGHPGRVGGEFIPLGARMCAIADAYDMMLAGFGGGTARSMEEALEELQRCAGTQFDPELVAVFDEMVRNESRDLGLDLASGAGMDGFQELVAALREDRGFL